MNTTVVIFLVALVLFVADVLPMGLIVAGAAFRRRAMVGSQNDTIRGYKV